MPRIPETTAADLPGSLTDRAGSLLDVVDNLLGKGVVVDGEVVLGLAGVDLIYLRLAALLVAADRVAGGALAAPASDADTRGRRTEVGGFAEAAPPSRAVPSGAAPETAPPDAGGVELFDLADEALRHDGAAVHVRPAPDEPLTSKDAATSAPASRWNPDPEEVRKGVMKLVLALAEFIKQLLERQAVRRLEAGTLSDEETERLGTALAQVEETLREMAERAGLDPADLNLDLGPLGKLV